MNPARFIYPVRFLLVVQDEMNPARFTHPLGFSLGVQDKSCSIQFIL